MGDMIAHIVGLDSRFTVSGHYAHAVLRTLPPIIHITKESEQAALRWAVERMMLELREPQPGGFLVAQHLAHMMLLQSLRLHLADGMGNQVGWFPGACGQTDMRRDHRDAPSPPIAGICKNWPNEPLCRDWLSP
ncbi:hypothetical protein GHJ84_17000 [Sinorhizobium meliloti]|nr:hypothetical protein [Sinorhizobium meliloti]